MLSLKWASFFKNYSPEVIKICHISVWIVKLNFCMVSYLNDSRLIPAVIYFFKVEQKNCRNVWHLFKINNEDVIDVFQVFLRLSFRRLHALFWCFDYWLWICWLGQEFRLYSWKRAWINEHFRATQRIKILITLQFCFN